jgi:hypothetical protein
MNGWRWWWLVAGGVVLVGHGVAAAQLFGGWAGLGDERPVLSGRHALHQYHAVLGAARLWQAGQNVCYDPAFEAGYPKTPVFDEGCRLAEVWYWLAGGEYAAGVYKWGVWALVAVIPVAAALALWGAGGSPAGMVAAAVLASVWTWSAPVQLLLASGLIDGLAAGLAALVFVPHLVRFSQTLDVEAWLLSAAAAVVIWYCQPLLWVPLGVFVFVHYQAMAPQRGLAWHLAYVGIACVGIVPNAWWLADWGKYWWLRPAWEGEGVGAALAGWSWGGVPGGSVVAAGGLLAALAGWANRWRCGSMIAWTGSLTALAARSFSTGPWLDAAGQRSLEVLSLAWGLFGLMGLFETAYRRGGGFFSLALAGYVALLALPFVGSSQVADTWWPEPASSSLRLGWTPVEEELLGQLRQQTQPSARILWEEREREADTASALLPLATQRWYIGGLHACLEHRYCVLRAGSWLGRPLRHWTDAELEQWLRWFNIGWVVARSDESLRRWQRYPGARLLWQRQDGQGPLALLEMPRPHSYLLAGRAEKVWGDCDRIVLEEVVPDEQGAVVLSLHYLPGLRVSPSYVRLERAPEPQGRTAVDLIRLHLPAPVPRIRLSWDNP